jgi:Fic family protein
MDALVIQYVTEEVQRQGHDTETLDGIERVGWMLNAWAYALEQVRLRPPSWHDAWKLGTLVESHVNEKGWRRVGVIVGGRLCPPFDHVPDLIRKLFDKRDTLAPLEFYKAFEEVHPFGDGNGRTGKILLNWLNGTLLAPIFPPDDLWGRPIRNP